jgi:hypothetical protein
VAIILIMQKKFFTEKEETQQETLNENTIADLNKS